MPTEFGKKMKKTTAKRVAKKPEAASAATKKKAKKLGLRVSRSKPTGGRTALSEKALKKLIKNRERKLKAEKKAAASSKKKKSKGRRSRYGSALVSGSSGYSNGDFTLSGCPSSTDGSACGAGVSTYSDHLTTSYPGTYVNPIAYKTGTAPDGANSWSASTPAHSSNWPTSEGFRSSYGKLLKRRAQIIKRLNALSR